MNENQLTHELRAALGLAEPPVDLWNRVRMRLDGAPAKAGVNWVWAAALCCAMVVVGIALQFGGRTDDSETVRLNLGPDLLAASFVPMDVPVRPALLDGYMVASYRRSQKKCSEVEQVVFENGASSVALFVAPKAVRVALNGTHPRQQFACGRQNCLLVCPRCSPERLASMVQDVNNQAVSWQ